MEASARSSARKTTDTTLPACLRSFAYRQVKAHCEQMVALMALTGIANITRGCPAFLLNIEKRSLPRLMLSGDGLASKDAV